MPELTQQPLPAAPTGTQEPPPSPQHPLRPVGARPGDALLPTVPGRGRLGDPALPRRPLAQDLAPASGGPLHAAPAADGRPLPGLPRRRPPRTARPPRPAPAIPG